MDPAILAAINYPLPPSPVMVDERLWSSPDTQKAERRVKQMVASYATYISDWTKRIEQAIAVFPVTVLDEATQLSDVATLQNLAEEIEDHAERRAKEIGKLQKHAQRDIKLTFKRNPSMGAVNRTLAAELLMFEEQIINTLLDYALWVRANKAMIDPATKGGRGFDTSAALTKYLDREIS